MVDGVGRATFEVKRNKREATLRSPALEPGAGRQPKRIAIVHDWCPDFRGGERVLAELCKVFKGAEVFTLFDFLSPEIKQKHFPGVVFHTSIANRIPWVEKFYRALFPICPFLIEQFDVTGYDAVISSSAAYARATGSAAFYMHVPAMWDGALYLQRPFRLRTKRPVVSLCFQVAHLGHARQWTHPAAIELRALAHQASTVRRSGSFPPVEVDEIEFTSEKMTTTSPPFLAP
jgi:hypothetical protein